MIRPSLAFLLVCAVLSAQVAFDPATPTFVGGRPDGLAAGDLDGDGDTDLVVEHEHTLCVLWNDSTGAFPLQTILAPGLGISAVTTGDLDGDGDLDLAVGVGFPSFAFGLNVLINDGAGAFSAPVHYPQTTGHYPVAIALADLNGDTDLDAVITSGSNDRVFIYSNVGDGTFTASVSYMVADPYGVALTDMDGDLDVDVAVASIGGALRVLPNNGGGTFGTPTFYPVGPPVSGVGPRSVAAADFDMDGDVDLAGEYNANSGPSFVSRILNQGGLSFTTSVDYQAGLDLFSLIAADLNGDGLPELAVVDNSIDRVFVLTNLANGNFGALQSWATGSEPIALIAADFDGDADLDLVTADFGSNSVSFLRNASPGSGLPIYPGSSEDLRLATGVNSPATSGLGHFLKSATAGDLISAVLDSPGATFNLQVPFLAANLFPTGSPPSGPAVFPEVHIDPLSMIVLVDGFNGPFGQILLPPTGVNVSVTLPGGLTGQSILVQGIVFAPFANNGLFAASDGYEFQIQ